MDHLAYDLCFEVQKDERLLIRRSNLGTQRSPVHGSPRASRFKKSKIFLSFAALIFSFNPLNLIMESQIHCLNPRLVSRISQRKPTYLCSFLLSPRPRVHKITSVSSYNHGKQISASTATTQTPISKPENIYAVNFQTLSSCKLGISRYPDFEYNAEGGRGTGTATRKSIDKDSNGEISVEFDLKTLYIPPLTSSTTKFLGLPLPPFLRIDITPEMFHGSIIPETGQVKGEFGQLNVIFSFWIPEKEILLTIPHY